MNFLFSKNKIKPLYYSNGANGCIASNKITVDGRKVGYLYREIPDTNSTFPDSGWRFFSGDENEEYTDDPSNFNIFNLNTICNYDPDIIPLLNSPYVTSYIRKGKIFIKE